jgi:hypothetical protein
VSLAALPAPSDAAAPGHAGVVRGLTRAFALIDVDDLPAAESALGEACPRARAPLSLLCDLELQQRAARP